MSSWVDGAVIAVFGWSAICGAFAWARVRGRPARLSATCDLGMSAVMIWHVLSDSWVIPLAGLPLMVMVLVWRLWDLNHALRRAARGALVTTRAAAHCVMSVTMILVLVVMLGPTESVAATGALAPSHVHVSNYLFPTVAPALRAALALLLVVGIAVIALAAGIRGRGLGAASTPHGRRTRGSLLRCGIESVAMAASMRGLLLV